MHFVEILIWNCAKCAKSHPILVLASIVKILLIWLLLNEDSVFSGADIQTQSLLLLNEALCPAQLYPGPWLWCQLVFCSIWPITHFLLDAGRLTRVLMPLVLPCEWWDHRIALSNSIKHLFFNIMKFINFKISCVKENNLHSKSLILIPRWKQTIQFKVIFPIQPWNPHSLASGWPTPPFSFCWPSLFLFSLSGLTYSLCFIHADSYNM